MQNPYTPSNEDQAQASYPQPVYQPRPSTDGFAITSMVLGIIATLSCYLGIIPGIIAIVFGHISMGKFKRNPQLGGKGMAIAGLVCGYIGITVTVCFCIFVFIIANEASEGFIPQLEQIQAEIEAANAEDFSTHSDENVADPFHDSSE